MKYRSNINFFHLLNLLNFFNLLNLMHFFFKKLFGRLKKLPYIIIFRIGFLSTIFSYFWMEFSLRKTITLTIPKNDMKNIMQEACTMIVF